MLILAISQVPIALLDRNRPLIPPICRNRVKLERPNRRNRYIAALV
jgi:hypothetical protein